MNDSFLQDNGQPDLGCLINAFTRCAPTMPGGIEWLDQVRLCNGPGDSPDGRKHASTDDPNSKAFPWENASNCKPFTADDVINELTARNVVAFWRSMIQRGAGTTDESQYAVALVEHLVFGPMLEQLDKETELSAQFFLSRGWCLLAPRWRTEFGLKAYELRLAEIQKLQNDGMQALAQVQQLPPEQLAQIPGDQLARLQQQAEIANIILDPTRDPEAKQFLTQWYETYVKQKLPEDFRARAPRIKDSLLNRVLAGLRGAEAKARVPIPYLCKNQLEIAALEPWREVCLPNEFTDVQELVFQLEYVTPTTLEGRILGEGYDKEWVEQAKKQTKGFNWQQLPARSKPVGLAGMLSGHAVADNGGGVTGDGQVNLICIAHAVYKALDADGIPAVYCTTFHPELKTPPKASTRSDRQPFVAKHELVEAIDNKPAYIEMVLEWRNRAITSSRSVIEMVASDQKLIKDTFDQIIDRGSITILPPVNVYESPTGAEYGISGPAIGEVQFGPGAMNRWKRAENKPEFMQMPSGQGMADGVQVNNVVQSKVNNRFGLMSEDVPAPRMQILQEKQVRRFLISWTRAFVYGLALCQKHMEDAEFARITGAPEGWLNANRETAGVLTSIFDFDVRELDSEKFIEQIEAMETTVIPQDTANVVDRANYTAWKARGIVGPRVARSFLRSLPSATQQLREKAENQLVKMKDGIAPTLIDKDDPTAAGLLNMTTETVLGNPKYVLALTPEALQAVAGEQLPIVLDRVKQSGMKPEPDVLFSNLLLQWIENLKFIGVTQQQNKATGRTGVDQTKS